MSTAALIELPLADISSPRSNQACPHSADPKTSPSTKMKDVSNAIKATRPSVYPKKRPSPHGISKSRKQSPLYPAHSIARKTPRAAKAELLAQRQREAQIMALRREGIYLEEEYREEIRYYMHEMEVSLAPVNSSSHQLLRFEIVLSFHSGTLCPPPLPWTSSQKSGGICARAWWTSLLKFTSHSA